MRGSYIRMAWRRWRSVRQTLYVVERIYTCLPYQAALELIQSNLGSLPDSKGWHYFNVVLHMPSNIDAQLHGVSPIFFELELA